MKAIDLMIGDWVYVVTLDPDGNVQTKKLVQVSCVCYDGIYYDDGSERRFVKESNLEPVKLTVDIIRKNFENCYEYYSDLTDSNYGNTDVQSNHTMGFRLYYHYYPDGSEFFAVSFDHITYDIHISSVHMLQHIMKIMQVEKDIIL